MQILKVDSSSLGWGRTTQAPRARERSCSLSPSPRAGEASGSQAAVPQALPCLPLTSTASSALLSLALHPPTSWHPAGNASSPPGKLLFTPQDRCNCPLLREAILDLPQGVCWTTWSRGKPPHSLPLLRWVTQEKHADPSRRVSPPMNWGVNQFLHLSPEAQPP